MSKLAALQGKAQKFKIGDLELELKPLTVDELSLFSVDESAPMKEQMKSSKELISKVLKNSVPDATDEEINNISIEHLQDLMNAIMKLHKLPEGDSRMQRIKDVIKNKQTGSTQAETPK